MYTMRLTASLPAKYDYKYLSPPIILTAYSRSNKRVFSARIGDGADTNTWKRLASECMSCGVCDKDETFGIRWDTIHGQLTISIQNRILSIMLTSDIDENYSVAVDLPAHICSEAFTDAARISKKWAASQ